MAEKSSFYVSGSYKTKAGGIGSFRYPRITADSEAEALDIARQRVQARKSYMGGIDAGAVKNR